MMPPLRDFRIVARRERTVRTRSAFFFLLIAASVAVPAGAQEKSETKNTPAPTPTIDQSLETKGASAPRISPDGRFVVYQVSETNWEDNAFETELWIAVVATGERYQLTNAKKSSSGARWSPDGKWIAFISDRDGKRQIYLISPVGGEARQITKVETGINRAEWSPDGKRIAFTMADPESKERKERKEKLGEWEMVDEDYTMSHLWVVDVPGAAAEKLPEPQRLTESNDFTVNSFAWSPDGTRIAFSAPKNPDPGFGGTSDLYVVTTADKTLKKIVDQSGPDSNPVWSPDGSEIAFETANGREFYYYLNGSIAVVPAGGGQHRVLDLGVDEDPSLEDWGPDGIYFSVLQKMSAHLYRLDPATQKAARLTAPADALHFSYTFTRDFRQAAFIATGPNRNAEVFTSALMSPFQPKQLTAMGEQYRKFQLAKREVITWKSTDGTPIEGVLYKPADFDPAKKYPLLVVIHGGPTGIDFPIVNADRYYPIEIFVSKGALVLRPNYRGSAGYGEKFRSLNVRNLGVGDAWDVISGVDYLIAQGCVDRARVGSMGWSQGGYISAFLTTSSDRFRAISVGAGISNWMTYYVNTDIHPFTRQYLHATPWDDPEIYAKTSPMTHILKAKTPTLIQHGERDARVPIPNAFELYQGLQDRGVPVRLVVYKGFGHGINKPKEQRAVMQHNLDWFREWIWGEKPAEKPAGETK
jgi:dipeptidyl aminopeptidase/acylaminoacyl peptidase